MGQLPGQLVVSSLLAHQSCIEPATSTALTVSAIVVSQMSDERAVRRYFAEIKAAACILVRVRVLALHAPTNTQSARVSSQEPGVGRRCSSVVSATAGDVLCRAACSCGRRCRPCLYAVLWACLSQDGKRVRNTPNGIALVMRWATCSLYEVLGRSTAI